MSTLILPESLKFLQKVKENNDRDWFNANKADYTRAHENFKAFCAKLNDEMTLHDEIERMKINRIYRDIRFSKDKTPYNPRFGVSFVRATKWRRGGYYFHIEPGNSFVGGGFWAPESADLKRIRKDIAADPDTLREIISTPDFKRVFGELRGDQLKTAPQGYAKDHPAIELLRYKQFLVMQELTDEQVMAPNLAESVAKIFEHMRPMFDYMSEVLTTDENGVPIE